MPKYVFKCDSEHTISKYVPIKCSTIPCEEDSCSKTMHRQMPVLNGPSNVTEVINKYTGITHTQDHKEKIDARKAEYYWTVEVPRFVASGIYTLETMLENGWVWVDDNLHVHTQIVPPHRR